MRWTSLRIVVLAFLAGTAIPAQGFAVEPSGSAVRVDRITNAEGVTGGRVLLTDGAVYSGDEITTNPNGLAQIRFVDDTRIVIGPNSRMVIDKFVFNPDQTAQQVSLNAVRGVFRFISGKSSHDAYSIRTPTATIGVRGTVVDINARGADSSVFFSEGAGTICGGGNCIEVVHTCQLWVVPRGGGASEATGIRRQQRLAAYFPLLEDQSQLDSQFRSQSNCQLADNRVFNTPYDNSDDSVAPPRASPTTSEDDDDGEDDDYCDHDYGDDDNTDAGNGSWGHHGGWRSSDGSSSGEEGGEGHRHGWGSRGSRGGDSEQSASSDGSQGAGDTGGSQDSGDSGSGTETQ